MREHACMHACIEFCALLLVRVCMKKGEVQQVEVLMAGLTGCRMALAVLKEIMLAVPSAFKFQAFFAPFSSGATA